MADPSRTASGGDGLDGLKRGGLPASAHQRPGLQPSRRESGQHAGRTPISKRGRAQLRAVVYMATLSSIRHNRRLRAHYERLTQRVTRPLPPMQAIGACMTKLLHYAFAVVKNRTAFDADHVWRDDPIAA